MSRLLSFTRRAPGISRVALMIALGAAALLVIAVVALRWASLHAISSSDVAAEQMARTDAGLIASELQKFRLLPLVLSEYPDVRDALAAPERRTIERLNGKLELLSERTDAAAIYVIAANGVTVAASNWRLPTSFMGQNYGFRPYFQGAVRDGSAELFALGTISGRPGLFIARRIAEGGKLLGVIVVKVEFNTIEAALTRQPGPSFVTDTHGVITITSNADWRFRTLRPLDNATRDLVRRTLQFGNLPLNPLTLDSGNLDPKATVVIAGERYRVAAAAVPLAGAELRYLQPLAPALVSANAIARTVILGAFILLVLVLGALVRVRERTAMQAEARRALEQQVALRTSELREANALLMEESRERERADQLYRASREELAQANRLGSIGQITAGVAHEINQPVAAIRTFAENSAKLLDRGDAEKAKGNLSLIVDLTARIGAITAELRAFARRGTPVMGAVEIGAAIDATLMLIGDRIRAGGIELVRSEDEPQTRVIADRIRLEQILINLIQNAIEAIADQPGGRIAITVSTNSHVRVDIADNGPGVSPEVSDSLFTPFITSKRDGLGLGLGIARDIAREFGGELDHLPGPQGGSIFRITLRCA